MRERAIIDLPGRVDAVATRRRCRRAIGIDCVGIAATRAPRAQGLLHSDAGIVAWRPARDYPDSARPGCAMTFGIARRPWLRLGLAGCALMSDEAIDSGYATERESTSAGRATR